jgi:hypothetical protein
MILTKAPQMSSAGLVELWCKLMEVWSGTIVQVGDALMSNTQRAAALGRPYLLSTV